MYIYIYIVSLRSAYLGFKGLGGSIFLGAGAGVGGLAQGVGGRWAACALFSRLLVLRFISEDVTWS